MLKTDLMQSGVVRFIYLFFKNIFNNCLHSHKQIFYVPDKFFILITLHCILLEVGKYFNVHKQLKFVT